MITEEEIKQRYERIMGELTERTRRLYAANEALSLGWGGISVVSRATGLARQVISAGIEELQGGTQAGEGRVRRKGGGRKSNVSKDPKLSEDLERLVEPVTRGDPESPLRWTNKSVRKLAKELQRLGHQVSHELVSERLARAGLQEASRTARCARAASTRTATGSSSISMHKQPRFWPQGNRQCRWMRKRKNWWATRKNPGREWHPQGEAEDVRVYDFPIKGLGRATPYGVYDLGRNVGWVNVGIDHDTAAFAVQSIRSFWNEVGRQQYPQAKRLLISADGGGSNGSRVRLWKWELQQLADETGLAITVCHLPPGTSKWNKIEHRLFAWISQNWRGKPLVSYAVILQLIAATTTEAGLTVQCQLDTTSYPAGRKISDDEMATLSIQPDAFHGEWNYTILPRVPRQKALSD